MTCKIQKQNYLILVEVDAASINRGKFINLIIHVLVMDGYARQNITCHIYLVKIPILVKPTLNLYHLT